MRALLVFITLLFLLACKPAVILPQNITTTACNPPYYIYSPGDCCLDADKNDVCDRDEVQADESMAINKTAEQPAQFILSDSMIKFRKNVDSYSFSHGKTRYFVKGDIIHVELDKLTPTSMLINKTPGYITDLFIDRRTKKATGYCDPRTEQTIMGSYHADRSKCHDLVNVEIPIDFETFNPVLPEDWLTRFSYAAPTKIEDTDQYVKDITGWKTVNPVLHFQDGNNEVILRLDSKTGMPIKVETSGPTPVVESYSWVVYNSVKPEEVIYTPIVG